MKNISNTENGDKNFITKYFKFSSRQATFKKEIIGGLVTFLAMAYILAVQPSMMSTVNIAKPGSMPIGGVFLATVISAFVATITMGILANVPISLAPGMGANAFFVFTVCLILKIDPYDAMAAVLVSGWMYFIIAITPARKYISKAMPKNLKIAIGAAIGLFLAFIGLQDSGIVQSDAIAAPWLKSGVTSATAVKLGDFKNPLIIVSIVILLLMFILHFLKIKGGIIIAMGTGVVIMSILWAAGIKDFAPAFKMNKYSDEFKGFSQIAGKGWTHLGTMFKNPLSYIAIFVFLYTDFFDTTGTLFVIGESAKINEREGEKWMTKANWADAIGTITGATIGASTVTSYIESTAGVTSGARTGFASVVTGSLFLLSIALWPIMNPLMPIANSHIHAATNTVNPATIMPITAPALILVGSLMMMQLKEFNWKEMIDVPALFITLVITMLSYSITAGIAAGVTIFVILNFFAGLKQYINEKRGKPQFIVGDETEIVSSGIKEKNEIEQNTLYWERLNIPMLIMFVMALTYFGTTVLYLYK
ncbi:NCS2 family permease [Mycoplasma marinum]|uniref:NCS2 family permease n=1 Tax=Mycoplasma marinum TaxID=1937190 RepID=A0A4R0XWS9_9MOLU|nr:NCS2 family permease [Mycoplasma marinum]TCG11441.1 NCS2 family permease [Mycoplasma marinum]